MSTTETIVATETTSDKPKVSEASKPTVSEHRIYIGNLPIKVKNADVRKFLEGFEFKDVRIPKTFKPGRRGQKRTAYAFVTLPTKEDVEKAVESLNEKTVGENTVSVKVADPKTETEEKPKSKAPARRPKKAADSASDEASDKEPSKESAPKKKSSRPRREPIPGTVSHEDTIFVSNLPFGAKKEQLTELFKDFDPKWAYITMGSVSRPNGTSKYLYGFVKFNDTQAQQQALKEKSEATLGSRKLRISVAKKHDPTGADSEKTEKPSKTTATTESTTDSTTIAEKTTDSTAVAEKTTEA